MKKVIAILLVLCVAVTLFAAGSVKVGGAFNFVTGGTRDLEVTKYEAGVKEDSVELKKDATYKMNGFGFDLAGDFDVAQNLSVWADFNMVFGNDFKFKTDAFDVSVIDDTYVMFLKKDGDYYSLGKTYDAFKETKGSYKKFNIVSFGAGVAYKFALDPVDVKLGGGLFLDRALGKTGFKDGDNEFYYQAKAVNFGLSLYANAAYKFNKNFGVGLTVMPHIGLYDSFKFSVYGNGSFLGGPDLNKVELVYAAKGFKLSFAMPVVLGVSYSF